jgi:hypothetical protein
MCEGLVNSQSAFAKSSPQRSNTKTTLAMDAIQNQGRFVFGGERPDGERPGSLPPDNEQPVPQTPTTNDVAFCHLRQFVNFGVERPGSLSP